MPASRMYVLAGVAAFFTLIEVTQTFLYLTMSGDAIVWKDAALLSGSIWILWAIFTPLVFFIARRISPDRVGRGRAVLLHLLPAVALAILHSTIFSLVPMLSGLPERWDMSYAEFVRKHLIVRTHLNLLTYAAIVWVYHAIELHHRVCERDLRTAELEASLSRAKLDSLRMQINPHFLFNALHAVSTLILRGDNAGADRVLGRLGELLRTSLDGAETHEVPLRQELEWLERYLDIERVRFSDRLSIEQRIPDELVDATVPYLVLQPLVENAIRHGIARRVQGGRLGIEARRVGHRLEIEVWNDGPELATPVAEGVGLSNTRARLAQLYGDAASLHLRERSGGVSVVISMPHRVGAPLHRAEPQPTLAAR